LDWRMVFSWILAIGIPAVFLFLIVYLIRDMMSFLLWILAYIGAFFGTLFLMLVWFECVDYILKPRVR